MAAETLRDPPGFVVKGDNWFHDGWLSGLFGLPERPFDDRDCPVRDIDIDSYRCGYSTAVESLSSPYLETFVRMVRFGQIVPSYRRLGD